MLWEREAEISAIADAIGLAGRSEGGLVVLRGPAGIGKSALLTQAQRRAEEAGMIVLRARAAPFERAFPFGVVRQLFEPVMANGGLPSGELLSGAAAGAASVLADEPGAAPAPDASFASLHGLYWLTANVAAFAPLLVCVDDVGWCDEPSLRYVEFLLRRLAGMPVAVGLAQRSGEAGGSELVDGLAADPLAVVLAPAPLGLSAVEEMLAVELAQEPDAEFYAACHEATGGNPLLLRELMRALAEQGVRPCKQEVGRVRAIGSVAVAPGVSRRFGSLPEPARAIAGAIAVLGERVQRQDLARTIAIDGVELEEMVSALIAAAIVDGADQLSFVHPLVADAVLASLSPSELAELHLDAVRALRERDASAWELAPHVMASRVHLHPDAVELLREAARWALGVGAPEAAVPYLARALTEQDPRGDLAPLLLELGRAKLHAGDPSAHEELARAIELALDPRTRAMARIELSVAMFVGGDVVAAIELLEGGIDEIAAEDPGLGRRMEAHLLANVQTSLHVPPSIGDRLMRARSAGFSRPSVTGRLVLAPLAHEEFVGGGAATDVVVLADEALANGEILSAEGPAGLPFYLAVIALLACDELERGAALLTVALAEARRLASLTGFVYASAWRAHANLRMGRLLDAEADARAALDSGDPHLAGPGMALARGWLAVALTEQGRLDEARATLRDVAEPDPPNAITFALLETRARLELAHGDYQAAADALERYLQLDEPTAERVAWRKPAVGFSAARSLRARALMGLGDIDGARALVAEEMPLARALGTHRAIGMTLHVAGLLDQGEQRIGTLRRAAEELAQSESRLEYADALADYGAALRRANRRAEARAPLKRSLSIAREARAGPLLDRVVQELRATGERVSRPNASGSDALTASEHRIASMAAGGMSNRDIAQSLFLTVKTIETHLGHAYQKLNLTRRAQLAAALAAGRTAEVASRSRAGAAPII